MATRGMKESAVLGQGVRLANCKDRVSTSGG